MSVSQYRRFKNSVHPSKGRHHSKEARVKMSIAKIGTHHSLSTINSIRESMIGKNSTPVDLYTKEGEFIKGFNSLKECAEFLNVAWVTVSKHVQGKTKTIHRKYIVHKRIC
jgi:hypothetical protein